MPAARRVELPYTISVRDGTRLASRPLAPHEVAAVGEGIQHVAPEARSLNLLRLNLAGIGGVEPRGRREASDRDRGAASDGSGQRWPPGGHSRRDGGSHVARAVASVPSKSSASSGVTSEETRASGRSGSHCRFADRHDLPRPAAPLCVGAVGRGESVVAVAERLGHENATLGQTTFGHLMPGSEDRTRRAMDEAWCALVCPSVASKASDLRRCHVVSSSAGTTTSRACASRGTRLALLPPRPSHRPAGWPRRRTSAGPRGRRRSG